jgi:hypothetical protein
VTVKGLSVPAVPVGGAAQAVRFQLAVLSLLTASVSVNVTTWSSPSSVTDRLSEVGDAVTPIAPSAAGAARSATIQARRSRRMTEA